MELILSNESLMLLSKLGEKFIQGEIKTLSQLQDSLKKLPLDGHRIKVKEADSVRSIDQNNTYIFTSTPVGNGWEKSTGIFRIVKTSKGLSKFNVYRKTFKSEAFAKNFIKQVQSNHELTGTAFAGHPVISRLKGLEGNPASLYKFYIKKEGKEKEVYFELM